MLRANSDLSRLVMLDMSPIEAVILLGLLQGIRNLRGEALGAEILSVIDDTNARIRLQLKQLHWLFRNPAPFPV